MHQTNTIGVPVHHPAPGHGLRPHAIRPSLGGQQSPVQLPDTPLDPGVDLIEHTRLRAPRIADASTPDRCRIQVPEHEDEGRGLPHELPSVPSLPDVHDHDERRSHGGPLVEQPGPVSREVDAQPRGRGAGFGRRGSPGADESSRSHLDELTAHRHFTAEHGLGERAPADVAVTEEDDGGVRRQGAEVAEGRISPQRMERGIEAVQEGAGRASQRAHRPSPAISLALISHARGRAAPPSQRLADDVPGGLPPSTRPAPPSSFDRRVCRIERQSAAARRSRMAPVTSTIASDRAEFIS